MLSNDYIKSVELLHKCTSSLGFIASAKDVSNYQRVWARDGVICGIAALASQDEKLIQHFDVTLQTLAKYQHKIGTIPSNVGYEDGQFKVSYGGLAGRVDAVTWFIIGVCQLAYYRNDHSIVQNYQEHITKCFSLLNAWEFNNKHLLYTPLSGNWADEYIVNGYVLYDQLLRLWALKSYQYFSNSIQVEEKINKVLEQIETNFLPNSEKEKFHEKAYNQLQFSSYLPCSFSPSGYKTQFDAFANSLSVLLGVGDKSLQNKQLEYCFKLAKDTKMGLLPAFWPVINKEDEDWNLLENNCKYDFRNHPYEFHNGGSWAMVNGFYGLALHKNSKTEMATEILDGINKANSVENFSFYENFNTKTTSPNGVSFCAWSGAGQIILHQALNNNFKLLI